MTGLVTAAAAALMPAVRSTARVSSFQTVVARHTDFDTVVRAPGRFDSVQSTEVRCGLERVGSASDSTILFLVDDGSVVKKDDVLCELDASAFRELLRRQMITVEQARASYQQAQLQLEVAQIGLRAFLDGDVVQTERMYQGQIALARADMTRQEGRLGWTQHMLDKGYLPQLQVSTEDQALRRAQLTLQQTESALNIFQRFSVPKGRRVLESAINGTAATLEFETIKLRREQERLALYEAMVERCTIRAPHGGLVLHANRPGRSAEIYVGATVRQRQRLLTLPDLSRMEVEVMLHETVVNEVQVGMRARVRSESLSGSMLNGSVTSIAPLPYAERRRESGNDVTYFVGHIRLDDVRAELRPGMTAEVEIRLVQRRGVLAVPAEAIRSEGDRDVCQVLRGDHLETRAVSVGGASHDLVEVVDGLSEGDRVVLDMQ